MQRNHALEENSAVIPRKRYVDDSAALNKFSKKEPMFILRADDQLTVREYKQIREVRQAHEMIEADERRGATRIGFPERVP